MRTPLVIIVLLALAGCAADGQWVQSTLYFGMSMPDGQAVTPQQWEGFVADEVTPRFPDGLTVVPASGQYRGADGQVVREPTQVLVLLYPRDHARRADRQLRAIVDAYCRRFRQESVLRVEQPAVATFPGQVRE